MKEYVATLGGVELTVKLKDATAQRINAKPVEAAPAKAVESSKSAKPANKSKAPANK